MKIKTKKLQDTFLYFKRRSRNNYVTSLVSMALVLFFLGLFLSIILFGNAFMRYAQESIVMKVFLYDGLEQAEQEDFMETLAQERYVYSVEFISKEDAGKILMERTGEDILQLMDGVNPLQPSINVRINSDYLNADSLMVIRSELQNELIVSEVDYPLEMIIGMERNIGFLSLVFAVLVIILVGIVFYLTFGTIRLAIYAKRLIIRSMQLIGATQSFIRKPFLIRGTTQGAFAGVIACLLLVLTFLFLRAQLEDLNLYRDLAPMGAYIGLLGGIMLFGMLLGFLGSFLAVNRYLNRNLDELL